MPRNTAGDRGIGRRPAGAVGWVAAAVVLAVAGGVAWWLAAPSPPDPLTAVPSAVDHPNVVLVIGCTVRRDQLAPYGGRSDVTPFLAELAAQGTRFADAVAAAPWTKAAATAILTGHHALAVGLTDPGPGRNERMLPEGVSSLAERFAAAGYTTVGGTHNPNLDPLYGLARGFDSYVPTAGRIRDANPVGTDLVDAVLAEVDHTRRPDAPLYLQVTLVDAHTPYTLEPGEVVAFMGDGPRRLATYRAALRRFDVAVAALDHGLWQRGLDASNTLFVVVADHGEGLSLPAHAGRGHGFHLHPAATAVPWIVRGPGVPAGGVVDGLASQVDVAPTLLGLAGVAPAGLPGFDLSGSVRRGTRSPRRRAFVDTWFYGVDRAAVVTPELQCQADLGGEIRDDDVFLEGCFDRVADPEQASPLPDVDPVARIAPIRTALAARGAAFDVVRADVPPPVSALLEALGYAE